MEENKNNETKIIRINLFQVSMTLGTYLGIYMILVYIMMGLSLKISALSLLSLPLFLGIPVIAFFLIKRFRDTNCKPFFPFPISWMITILTFLFASVLSCMMVYVYLRFLDNGAFSAGLMERMNMVVAAMDSATQSLTDTAQIEQMNSNIELFKSTITWYCSLSPSAMTKQLIQSSIFWNTILSVIIGLITSKRIRLQQ